MSIETNLSGITHLSAAKGGAAACGRNGYISAPAGEFEASGSVRCKLCLKILEKRKAALLKVEPLPPAEIAQAWQEYLDS